MSNNFSSEVMVEYRKTLLALEQKSQDSYDKTLITLATSAFGVSFVFVDKHIDPGFAVASWLLILAWVSWSLSAASVLASHYSSQKALRKAIEQVDQERIHDERPGGWFNSATAFFNGVSGLLFIVGLFSIIRFVQINW